MTRVFRVGDKEVSCDDHVRLLGVDIDYLINCRKASQQINVLRRIGRFLTPHCRKAIYHAFIMSNFNLCSLLWHFCNKPNTNKLHYRALKFFFFYNENSYESLLERGGFCTLHLCRLRNMALDTFKIINGDNPSYLKEFIHVKNPLILSGKYNKV